MTARLAPGSEILFIEATATGTVHLFVQPPEDEDPPREEIIMDGSGRALAALLGTPTVTRCGKPTFPYSPSRGARHQITYRFADGQLCVSCYRTLHPDDQARAFDHPQPDDADAA
ncbi:hypothetical protein [Streptomyces sp. NPDC020983]|uniref:hypothetical protein n=1 Tax=Streptomyces sp. NPDC020983 TaxID=3365106 RepID=UPI0037A48CE7